MINVSLSSRVPQQTQRLSSSSSPVQEDPSGPVESFVSGAASAIVGAAILGGSTLVSAVQHYPKHAGEVIQESCDSWKGDFGSVMQAATVPLVMFNMLVSPVALAILGLGLGAYQGATEGSQHGMGAAFSAVTELAKSTDQYISDAKWMEN